MKIITILLAVEKPENKRKKPENKRKKLENKRKRSRKQKIDIKFFCLAFLKNVNSLS
jgi:hypothetical protein